MWFALLVLAAAPPCEPCTVVSTPVEALRRVLAREPTVLAVGEYHEVKGAPKVPSAIRRFTSELLPSLQSRRCLARYRGYPR